MISEPKFREKFIAFVDILGFSSKVESVEKGDGTLSTLLQHCSKLEQPLHAQEISNNGPMICPESRYKCRTLDYVVTQISDCVVISSEVSPAGIINLIHHVSASIFALFTRGMMVRGYVTRGSICHNDKHCVGTGYQRAFNREKSIQAFCTSDDDVGTPFVEVDPTVLRYIRSETDSCVRTMFDKLVKEDQVHEVTVLFPFRHLIDVVGGNIGNPEKCRNSISIIRTSLRTFGERLESQSPSSEPSANRKAKYYREIIDELLAECDRIESFVELLKQPEVKIGYDSNLNVIQFD